jgi:hypothetical protein
MLFYISIFDGHMPVMVCLPQFEKPCCRQVPYNSEKSVSKYIPFTFVYSRHLSVEVGIKTMIMLKVL